MTLDIINNEPYTAKGIPHMYFYDKANALVLCVSPLKKKEQEENVNWMKKYGKPLYDTIMVDGKEYVEWESVGLAYENWENLEARNEYLHEWQEQRHEEVEYLIKQEQVNMHAGLSDKQHYMVEGIDRLIGKLNQYPNEKTFTVEEIIGISNSLYYEITREEDEVQIIKAPTILNEHELADQLAAFFEDHSEISNQGEFTDIHVESFMNRIYDSDGKFHRAWLKQEVIDAVAEPVDISMKLHNVELGEEDLTYHNMNLQTSMEKLEDISKTMEWLVQKKPAYKEALEAGQTTVKYNMDWIKEDMELVTKQLNEVMKEKEAIEKAVEEVIATTELEWGPELEM